jgi:tRNA(Ile)-lysidine synthase
VTASAGAPSTARRLHGSDPATARPPQVARVLRTVTATVRRHGMFEPGSLVVAAVSGGPDSMCLLHALVRLRRLLRIRVACFHFDHRLRESSASDAAYVRRHAERLGLPFILRQARSRPRRGQSVEAWARIERYAALSEAFEELGAGSTAVGHTADDQAETVLLALVRGGGLESLGGMRPVVRPIVRPLLEVTRKETLAFCRALGLRPRRDPMNDDPAYLRVAIRGRVIPDLERATGRGIRSTLTRTAELLRADGDLLAAMADDASSGVLERADGDVRLHAGALGDLPLPLASRLVRRALQDSGGAAESRQVQAVLSLAAGGVGRSRSLGGGLRARREREYVRLSRPSPRSLRPGEPAAE